jgi:hypothetical protein
LCEWGGQVVDATPMYEQLVNGASVHLYDDFEIHPVWPEAVVCYVNGHGNVHVLGTCVTTSWEPWETPNEVDWSECAGVQAGFLFLGGKTGNERSVPTTGPWVQLDVAYTAAGRILDIRFRHLTSACTTEMYENMMLVWLQTVTLAGCVNVEITEPVRPRAERRRMDRIGVSVSSIVIRRTSKWSRSTRKPGKGGEVPQQFVRGHFARYGEDGRGLLFGKLAGRFWIPAHARGSVDRGVRDVDYVVAS